MYGSEIPVNNYPNTVIPEVLPSQAWAQALSGIHSRSGFLLKACRMTAFLKLGYQYIGIGITWLRSSFSLLTDE